MRVLGIESSCDETGVALYDGENGGLLAHALHTQMAMHAEYGGVVPELASRDHVRRLIPLVREVMQKAELQLSDIDAIAYTQGPGLAGALLVGATFAESLAWSLEKPVIPVHHLEGHLLSPLLSSPALFPFVALLVSGGHTQLMSVEAVGHYQLLGDTLDDAAGEAFDKSAKLLGLGYPGGPELAKLAEMSKLNTLNEKDKKDSTCPRLPRPMMKSGDLNFSFSGLKTAVLNQVQLWPDELHEEERQQYRSNLAWAVQEAIADILVEKSARALRQTGLKRLVVAGGVGANRRLRQRLLEQIEKRGVEVYYPKLEFCTDNGAMIALTGWLKWKADPQVLRSAGAFSVKPRWPMSVCS